MQVDLQFLEVHEPIEPVADVVRIEGLIGHSVADCLVDVITDTDAQLAVAVARVDRPTVLKTPLPLGWARDAGPHQRHQLQHRLIVADKTLRRRTTTGSFLGSGRTTNGGAGARSMATTTLSTMKVIDETLIAEAGRRLAAAAPDAQVILFGSHARGEARPHSDVDFLVVEPEVANEAEESVRLHRTLRDLRMPADVIVVSRDYADSWREVRGGLVHAALSQGRVLAG